MTTAAGPRFLGSKVRRAKWYQIRETGRKQEASKSKEIAQEMQIEFCLCGESASRKEANKTADDV